MAVGQSGKKKFTSSAGFEHGTRNVDLFDKYCSTTT